MKYFSHIILISLIALSGVAPVLACCSEGHAPNASHVSTIEVEPACHDAGAKAQTQNVSNPLDSIDPNNCPACIDCDATIANDCGSTDVAVLAEFSNEIPLASNSAVFLDDGRNRSLFPTGPPKQFRLFYQTPITLKQRLLI
jgi:hypothetical protein